MRACGMMCAVWLWIAGTLAAEDLVIADFEGPAYAPWVATGEAFGVAPAQGTLPGQMPVDGFRGKGLVNSFLRGDGTTGILTSPEFRIERRWLTFLIGGGRDPERLTIQLHVDGQVVRTATGGNDRPGGSETLVAEAWDVEEFRGRLGTLQIIDQATGGWGHINVDHIVLTDTRPKGTLRNAERSLVAETRYLHLPIKNGGPKRIVTLLVEGQPVVRNEIELADGSADWWAPMEIAAWRGKSLTVRVDKLPEDSTALSAIEPGDELKEAAALYQEALRAQFHFSPRRGWNNDPNGLVYFRGEYHLFFQHNPYGWGWGNMHWGHAVSRDLVHWEELGDKLLPDDFGPMFSGSAVVDVDNTSGFGKPGEPPLILLYTAAGNPTTQCLAWSLDGRTFTKYAGNPVLNEVTPGNRDPKVLWHAPMKRWVMVLYVEKPAGRHTVHFYTSPNLREWTYASHVDGDPQGRRFLFECPDLFELPVEGTPSEKRWVLFAADSQYAIGTFDGTTFHAEQTHLPGHRGRGFYAAQTYSDLPAADGRRIMFGWLQTETRGMPFNQGMSLPLELGLKPTAEGPRLTWSPARELIALRSSSSRYDPVTLHPGDRNLLAEESMELGELRWEIEPAANSVVTCQVRGVPVVYDTAGQTLSVNGHATPVPLRDGRLRVTLFVDRTSLELFADDGLIYVPYPINVDGDNHSFRLETTGGEVKVHRLETHALRSAWR